MLHEIGLTDRPLTPHEFALLRQYGIGLTDVVKDQEGMDSEIEFKDAGSLIDAPRGGPNARPKIPESAEIWESHSLTTLTVIPKLAAT